MEILQFIVSHLGPLTLFIVVYEAIDQTGRCIRRYIEQGTLQEEERTKQMRIDLMRQTYLDNPTAFRQLRGALRDMDLVYSDEDLEYEENLNKADVPPMVYRGAVSPEENRVNDPMTM